MTSTKNNNKTCPHCGAPSHRRGAPWHLLSSIVVLAAAIFLWDSRRAASDASGHLPLPGRLSENVIDFIAGKTDDSCRACLSSADKFLAEKKAAALEEKTKGMALIPSGEYLSGSPESSGDPDEHPLRHLQLNAFYIDKNETTTSEYMRFVKSTSANYPEWAQPGGKYNIDNGKDAYYKPLAGVLRTCGDCPIVGVTPKNAAAYCQSLNKRLPTEAEWEAAARAGSASVFYFGDDPRQADAYAWNENNSAGTPHPVGQKKPNGYGLYDMHGNVWEWTADFYDSEYYGNSGKRDPKGPEKGKEYVIRGGSWAFDMHECRSANRASSEKANDDIGFRCAVSADAAESVIPSEISGRVSRD